MLTKDDVQNVFSDFKFPNVDNPISYNGDSDKLSDYLIRLSKDEEFLNEEAQKLGVEVQNILSKLKDDGAVLE